MAIAEKWLANRYYRPSYEIFDYNIYAVCGDGCMMEGIGSEAASLAGHLALDNLCWIYDNNHITIEGSTRITFTEDIAARFLGYGWNVLRVGDANDIDRIEHALDIFRKNKGRPTFIILDSHIGYGSPHKQDTAAAHGEPLGEEEIRLAKRDYGWPEDAKFLVPDAVRDHFAAGIGTRGPQAHGRWSELFAAYRSEYPKLATEIDLMQRRDPPAGWDAGLPIFPADPKGIAGRDASGRVLNVLAQNVPWLLGGSPSGPSRAWSCCDPRTPRRSWRPTAISSSCDMSRPPWRCRANPCRLWTAVNMRPLLELRAAPMCSATLPVVNPK
jgi:transketolase